MPPSALGRSPPAPEGALPPHLSLAHDPSMGGRFAHRLLIPPETDVVDSHSYKLKGEFTGHDGPVWALAVSKKQQMLISGSSDESIRVRPPPFVHSPFILRRPSFSRTRSLLPRARVQTDMGPRNVQDAKHFGGPRWHCACRGGGRTQAHQRFVRQDHPRKRPTTSSALIHIREGKGD
jgi:hypothetical protein